MFLYYLISIFHSWTRYLSCYCITDIIAMRFLIYGTSCITNNAYLSIKTVVLKILRTFTERISHSQSTTSLINAVSAINTIRYKDKRILCQSLCQSPSVKSYIEVVTLKFVTCNFWNIVHKICLFVYNTFVHGVISLIVEHKKKYFKQNAWFPEYNTLIILLYYCFLIEIWRYFSFLSRIALIDAARHSRKY